MDRMEPRGFNLKGLGFLRMYRSKSTVHAYTLAIRSFLEVTYGAKIENGGLERCADRYLSEKRDHNTDLQNFLVAINGRPPKTIRLYLAGVKQFLIENGIELKAQFWKSLSRKVKGSRALTRDRVPTNAELKRLVMLMPPHGKALILLLLSSGMRIGEALRIEERDLELDEEPMRINIRGEYTKTGNPRLAFASSEAKEQVEEWLRLKPSYIENANKKPFNTKPTDDPRVFPFQQSTAYMIYINALNKAGLTEKDASTDRNTRHLHTLRKFFRTRLGAIVPVDIVEALMGHEGYLTEVYRRYSVYDMAEAYRKGEHALYIFSNGAEVTKLKVEVEEKSKVLNEGMAMLAVKNAGLENRLTAMIAENQAMKNEMQSMAQKNARLENQLQDVQHSVNEMAVSLKGIEQLVDARKKQIEKR
jgi:integrase